MTLKKIKIAITLFLMMVFFLFLSCAKSKAVEEETSIKKKLYLAEKNEVETIVLKNDAFQKELVSNGKIIVTQKE